jgi:hypothetical protein
MKELLSVKVSGLFTYSDVFSAVPEGAMSIAQNIVIDQTNIFSPRRGFEMLDTTNLVSNQLNTLTSIKSFNDKITVFSSDTAVGTINYLASGTWSAYVNPTPLGSTAVKFVKPSGTVSVHTANGNKNTYLTTSEGIKKTQSTNIMVPAGVPQGYSPTLSLTTVSAGSLLPSGATVAYRTVFGYKDLSKNTIYGAPSSRVVITNTTATDKNVTITQTTPNTNVYPVDTTWFVRIYRTEIAENSTEPGDEMFLVTEINFAYPAVTLTYEDLQPDDLLTLPLYTNLNQDTIAAANYPPPAAKDITPFNGYMFYANITNPAKATRQLLSTGKTTSTPNALGTGDSINITEATNYSITGKYLVKYQGDISTEEVNGGAATNNRIITDVPYLLTDVMANGTLSGRTITNKYLSSSPTYDAGLTFTVTIASPAVVTHTCDGLKTGDKIKLKTTGALPTGLNTTDEFTIVKLTSTTCNLKDSTGATINTSGSQSGTHTFSGIVKMDNVVWNLPTGTCRKTRSAELITTLTSSTITVGDGTDFSVGQVIRLDSSNFTITAISGNVLTLNTTGLSGTPTLYYYDVSAGWSIDTEPGASLVLEDVSDELFDNLKVQDKLKLTGDTTVYTVVSLNATDKTITLDTAITTTTSVNSLTAITVYPQNVEFEVSESKTSSQFYISVSVFAARDVEETAIQIAATLNSLNKPVTAYYNASDTSIPGQIDFVEAYPNATSYLGNSFQVDAGTTIGFASVLDVNAERKTDTNLLYYSKFQESEHVPLANNILVGQANTVIKRIAALRTALLIFADDGIYKLTGSTASSFQVNLLDNTAKLIADESLAILNNSVIGLFDQGVCQVSEAVNIISRPIEDKLLLARNQATADELNNLTFGVGYQSDRKYLLSLPQSTTEVNEGTGSKILVFNILNQTWTEWDRKQVAGCIGPDDKLHLIKVGVISRERKSLDESDIVDEQILLNDPPTLFNPNTETATAIADYFTAGDYVIVTSVPMPEISINDRIMVDFSGTLYTTFVKVVDHQVGSSIITLHDPLYSSYPTMELGACSVSSYPDYAIIALSVADYANARVGDVLWTHNGRFSRISAKDDTLATITVLDPVWFTDDDFTLPEEDGGPAGVPTILPYINVVVEWTPITNSGSPSSGASPTSLKHYSEATLITTNDMQQPILGFRGATNPGVTYIEFENLSSGSWGMFGWGNSPWGGEPSILRYRTYIPSVNQRDSMIIPRLEQKTSLNKFECSGLSISFRQLGQRAIR